MVIAIQIIKILYIKREKKHKTLTIM